MRKYELEKNNIQQLLDNIYKIYEEALYLQKGFFKAKWNILTIRNDKLICYSDNLKDLKYNLLKYCAEMYGNSESSKDELIKFGKNEKII